MNQYYALIVIKTPFVPKIKESQEEEEASLESLFLQAQTKAALVKDKYSDVQLLPMYSLFKQATKGDCTDRLILFWSFMFMLPYIL